METAQKELDKLVKVINDADDGVFANFCRRIKVSNIHEYEDVQLKMAREESEAMEKYSQQQARASHQYVWVFFPDIPNTDVCEGSSLRKRSFRVPGRGSHLSALPSRRRRRT